MLTGVLRSLFPPETTTFDMFLGISDAFEASLHRAVVPTLLAVVVTAVVLGAGVFALVRRIEREDPRRRSTSPRCSPGSARSVSFVLRARCP